MNPVVNRAGLASHSQRLPVDGSLPQDAISWQRHFFLRRPTAEHFTTIAVVGQGAYGMVRVVRDTITQAVFALKQMSKADLTYKSRETLVIQEINVLYRANTPWVPKLYYAWQDDFFLYLLMEFTMGGDLMKHLTTRERFSESVCRFYIAELVLALAYVHETLQCAHRDIKPENILLDAAGHIKLGDFGLSKFVGPPLQSTDDFSNEALGVSRVIRTPQTKWRESGRFHERIMTGAGTTDYMAPEIHRQGRRRRRLGNPLCQETNGCRKYGVGLQHGYKRQERLGYNRTVDWWSVGVVLFDMLFGKLPFSDECRIGQATTERIIHWKRHLAKLPMSSHISNDCEHFLRQLLAEPEDRIQTAAEAARHPWLKSIEWKSLRHQKPPLQMDTKRLGLNNFDLVSLSKFLRWETRKKEEAKRAHVLIRIKVPDPPQLSKLFVAEHLTQPSAIENPVPSLNLRSIIPGHYVSSRVPSSHTWRVQAPLKNTAEKPHPALATYRPANNEQSSFQRNLGRYPYTFRGVVKHIDPSVHKTHDKNEQDAHFTRCQPSDTRRHDGKTSRVSYVQQPYASSAKHASSITTSLAGITRSTVDPCSDMRQFCLLDSKTSQLISRRDTHNVLPNVAPCAAQRISHRVCGTPTLPPPHHHIINVDSADVSVEAAPCAFLLTATQRVAASKASQSPKTETPFPTFAHLTCSRRLSNTLCPQERLSWTFPFLTCVTPSDDDSESPGSFYHDSRQRKRDPQLHCGLASEKKCSFMRSNSGDQTETSSSQRCGCSSDYFSLESTDCYPLHVTSWDSGKQEDQSNHLLSSAWAWATPENTKDIISKQDRVPSHHNVCHGGVPLATKPLTLLRRDLPVSHHCFALPGSKHALGCSPTSSCSDCVTKDVPSTNVRIPVYTSDMSVADNGLSGAEPGSSSLKCASSTNTFQPPTLFTIKEAVGVTTPSRVYSVTSRFHRLAQHTPWITHRDPAYMSSLQQRRMMV